MVREIARGAMAMKLVSGETLTELLRTRPEQAQFLQIFEAICQAVAFAHSRDVIHRDLKPANVMVGKFGEVLVMDWGLARVGVRSTEAATVVSLDEEGSPLNQVGVETWPPVSETSDEVEALAGC